MIFGILQSPQRALHLYNNLEIDKSWSKSPWTVVTFRNHHYKGGVSGPQHNTYCYAPPENCTIESFRAEWSVRAILGQC